MPSGPIYSQTASTAPASWGSAYTNTWAADYYGSTSTSLRHADATPSPAPTTIVTNTYTGMYTFGTGATYPTVGCFILQVDPPPILPANSYAYMQGTAMAVMPQPSPPVNHPVPVSFPLTASGYITSLTLGLGVGQTGSITLDDGETGTLLVQYAYSETENVP
jgi:hypothetical protein